MAETRTALSRGGVMLADGSFFEGVGFGAPGAAVVIDWNRLGIIIYSFGTLYVTCRH